MVLSFSFLLNERSPWLIASHLDGSSTSRLKVIIPSSNCGYQNELPERYTPSLEMMPGVFLKPRACSLPYGSIGWYMFPLYLITKVLRSGGSFTLNNSNRTSSDCSFSPIIFTPEVGEKGLSPR